jgi:hypothetical protein
LSNVERWKLQERLAAQLDNNIDLVDLKNASVVLRKEIIEKGQLIYVANRYNVEHFEMTTLSMYLDLNETRKHILNDYKNEYGRDSAQ